LLNKWTKTINASCLSPLIELTNHMQSHSVWLSTAPKLEKCVTCPRSISKYQTLSAWHLLCLCHVHVQLVRDSSAVRRLFSTCCRRGTSESSTHGKQRICLSNSWSAHFHVSWLSDFIFYQKPLYKSLHQSFFYSFITILPSESGVTLHYSTILS
jgi:hypothetical protein